jgi:ABC-type multidrug transport system fused ATPase/permease subunit
MLHAGICQWQHCLFVLNASAVHPPEYLQNALTKIENAWDCDTYRKTSINSWIGTLAIESDIAYCLRSSANQADLEPLGNGECLKIQTTYGTACGDTIFDYVFSTRLERGGATFRPIHDMTLHHEATLLAKAIAIMAKLKIIPRRILELKTDSILFDAGVRLKSKVKTALAETTFANLHKILPKGRLDNTHGITQSNSVMFPFRCFATSDDSDRLHCIRKLPITSAEIPQCARIWREIDATHAISAGESVLITGRPGTGKSHLVRTLIELLRSKNEFVTILAKTHLAAHNVNGVTINHFANKTIRMGEMPTRMDCSR